MITATPKAQPQQQQPAAKAPANGGGAPNAPHQSPTERLANILRPELENGQTQNSGDGKKKPKAPKDTSPKKPQGKPAKAPKAAVTGQADDAGEGDAEAIQEGDEAANQGQGDLETDETDATDEDGDTESGDENAEDTEEGTEDDDGTLYTVKVNGEAEEVTLSELLKGYSRTRDYQQKTAALAKERREVETVKESVKDLPHQRETYVKNVERFTQAAAVMTAVMQQRYMPKPPDPALAQTDPANYYAAKEAHEDGQKFMGALQQEVQTAYQKMEADGKAHHAKAYAESRKKLYEVMPEMTQAPARAKLVEYANKIGFTNEQIQQETNTALFVCVEKARRWDELQERQKSLKPKAPIGKVTRRTHAGETHRAARHNNKTTALATHKQQGTVKSAEKALTALFAKEGE